MMACMDSQISYFFSAPEWASMPVGANCLWLGKSDTRACVEIHDAQSSTAINDLLARGTVERQGERRSARYRISESD